MLTRLQILIPIGSDVVHYERSARLTEVVAALSQSLARIEAARRAVSVAILLNGSLRNRKRLLERLDMAEDALRAAPSVIEVRRIYDTRSDKIHSLNRLFRRPSYADGVMVMDDDILVPPSAVSEVFDFLKHRNRHDEAYCFPKCAIATAALTTLTPHRREMAFLFHPSTMRLLQRTPLFAPRPSGSLYALPKEHVIPFPEPCNEAEILRRRRHLLSDQYARTWYPSTMHDEILRRARQHRVSIGIRTSRPKNNDFLLSWEDVSAELPGTTPPWVATRLERAFAFQRHIVLSSIARVGDTTGNLT